MTRPAARLSGAAGASRPDEAPPAPDGGSRRETRFLRAASVRRDVAAVRAESPELWRHARRFQEPVQLALAAADDVARRARRLDAAALISLAPSRCGSPDLFRWGRMIQAGEREGRLGAVRMNPTHTLHAVDNLALSAFAILHGHRAYGLGLLGLADQALAAVEEALARDEEEVLVFAGDQDEGEAGTGAIGVALLLSREPAEDAPLIARVAWGRSTAGEPSHPHAAAVLAEIAIVAAVRRASPIRFVAGGREVFVESVR